RRSSDLGQVAALRRAVVSVRELHRQVSAQSTEASPRVQPEPRRVRRESNAAGPIAIVGMACVYPDAPDLETFWANILLGKSAIREVPRTRWDPEMYFDPQGSGDKTPSKWGGFIPQTLFDP